MSATPSTSFDYLFVGLGAANCLLLLRMHDNGLLFNKKVAVIEPNAKNTNDRTFCFWSSKEELVRLGIEDLISSKWSNIKVSGTVKQSIAPLNYYHVKAIDLYTKVKSILQDEDVTFYSSFLKSEPIRRSDLFEIQLEHELIAVKKVFDSRPPSYSLPEINQSHLLQSFIGWEVQTPKDAFDPSTVVMMDFNIPQNDSCQFMYVLPFTERSALVEVTRFGTEKITTDEADVLLSNYLSDLGFPYVVVDKEYGVIPMTSSPIVLDDLGQNWIRTGARADMLKSTTGFAFHSMAEDAVAQVEAISENKPFVRKQKKSRFKFYDRLLLKILERHPSQGKRIFESLFRKVSIFTILMFMREKTSVSQEVSLFSKLPKSSFIYTALSDIQHRTSTLPAAALAFVFTLIAVILFQQNLEVALWTFLGVGFLTIGLSHGAVDHLTGRKLSSTKQLLQFVASYLLKGAFLGIIWIVLPDVALFIFLAYSAWHFGQADFKEWKLKQGWRSFSWGGSVLFLILLVHFHETVLILDEIAGLRVMGVLKAMSSGQILMSQLVIFIFALLMALVNKSRYALLTLTYLLISIMLPLLISFAIYFVLQHSLHGWRHLKKGLNTNSYNLWVKSLPFSISGAAIILCSFVFINGNYSGLFFILLSCISLPHVLSMHHFYSLAKFSK